MLFRSVKVNTDGAVRDGLAAAGGVIRDCTGVWLYGFVHFLGSCSVPMAELWDIISSLRLAWSRGYRRICLETDSMLSFLLLNKSVDRNHPLFSLVFMAQGLLSRDWVIQFRHVFREANCVADNLASYAFSFLVGCLVLDEPHSEVALSLLNDVSGSATPRFVA